MLSYNSIAEMMDNNDVQKYQYNPDLVIKPRSKTHEVSKRPKCFG